jgi:hypothetical protein
MEPSPVNRCCKNAAKPDVTNQQTRKSVSAQQQPWKSSLLSAPTPKALVDNLLIHIIDNTIVVVKRASPKAVGEVSGGNRMLAAIPEALSRRSAPATWIKTPSELSLNIQKARSLAEMKVVLYVLHHTYGYQEYNSAKRFTLDELQYGRKRRDGTRMDEGTSLARSSLKIGIKQAVEDGLLYELVDTHDLGRIAKYYAVRLPSDDVGRTPTEEGVADEANSSGRGSESDPGVLDYNPGGSEIGFRGPDISHRGASADQRSEKDTLERNFRKKQKKDTSAVGAEELREKKKKEESNESSNEHNASTPAGSETGGTPPAPVPASEEGDEPMEEDLRAQAERVGIEEIRRWLLAKFAETGRRAKDYRLSSSERLRAKEQLQALELTWRREFPGDPAGWE